MKYTVRNIFAATVIGAAAAVTVTGAHATTDPTTAKGYTQTQYPIVLVHGFLGFDSILGINYFYGIPSDLRNGGARVYVAQVNPSQTTEYRGEQLLQQLKAWAAKDGVTKFNLIGHSHGGPTVRYVAGVAPELVASVTTVAGTNFGSVVADKIGANTHPGSPFDKFADSALQLLDWLAGGSQTAVKKADLLDALTALSTADSARFNANFPNGAPTSACGQGAYKAGDGIYYASATGISVKTNAWDISDPILAYTATYFGTEANDGLVSQCSSHWGKVLKDTYKWNHLDEINQVFGTIGKDAEDPKQFYRQQANRLKNLGL